MSSTNNNVIMSVLTNKVLLRHMFSLIREEYGNHCPANMSDCYYYAEHLYKHLLDSLVIMDKGWYSLMADRIKSGDSLDFSHRAAVELCNRVTDTEIFTTVYSDKQIYFTDPECLKTAITKGNIIAVRILLDQHDPVNLFSNFTVDLLIQFALTASQYHMVEFLIDRFSTHEQHATSQNIFDEYVKKLEINTIRWIGRNLQTVPCPEKVLQTYKHYLGNDRIRNSFVIFYFSDVFYNETKTPTNQCLGPLYSYCKVNGLVEDVQQFKSQCDQLLQQSIDNSVSIINNFINSNGYHFLLDIEINPYIESFRETIQLVMLFKLINDGVLPDYFKKNMIQNIFKRTTTHPFIIPFLMDTLLAKERDSTIQCLCKIADSFDSVIVAHYYKLPAEKQPPSLKQLFDSYWYRAMKCAAWKGDLFTLKKLLDHHKKRVELAVWDELIDLAICRENLNVLEFIVVKEAVKPNNENFESIGYIGSLPCLQLLLDKTLQDGDFKKMIRAVHEIACDHGQTKFISDIYDQIPDYNRVYWSNIIHSGIIDTAYLQFGIHEYDDQEILELIEIAISMGKVEFYQFFVEQLQDTSILNQLSPNKKPEHLSHNLYPIYIYRLLEPRKI
ncbi:hypothetical protein PPL_10478 [Heterostelium album PN500]|uniref:Uncharacterized protein n=1 Tax=Heterostelium pallidum (strain ATCC 26659 / Pp 5 / PN500) TaxID=670386 RepID=D3BR74_HETP5|nr:hypothetical protein PPL_10478 [Heterostelium album PN500]EFA75906.1 hypothetical protein PPL_10478 [Heterostelium album PN500]|eukprot:XP_020428040.1 hypothetical protein PPL_10478 [Heterostelium album PN500]